MTTLGGPGVINKKRIICKNIRKSTGNIYKLYIFI
jgi:hypothetical protein